MSDYYYYGGSGTGYGGASGGGTAYAYDGPGSFGSGVSAGDDFYYSVRGQGSERVSVEDYSTYSVDNNWIQDASAQSANVTDTENKTLQEITVTGGSSGDAGAAVEWVPDGTTLDEIVVTAAASKGGKTSTNYVGITKIPQSVITTLGGSATKGTSAYYAQFTSAQNPAKVKILASGNTITLFWDQAAAHGFGHLEISINGSLAAGFEPISGASGPGYIALGGDNGPDSQGNVLAMTMDVTPAQAQAAQNFIASSEASGGPTGSLTYNVFGNNCTEWAGQAAYDAGQFGGAGDVSPGQYWVDQMNWELGQNKSNIVGSQVITKP
jgi:hypothetical protein